jgi:hypothetical protein
MAAKPRNLQPESDASQAQCRRRISPTTAMKGAEDLLLKFQVTVNSAATDLHQLRFVEIDNDVEV